MYEWVATKSGDVYHYKDNSNALAVIGSPMTTFIRTQSVRDCPHSLSLNLFRSISLHGPSNAC